MIRGAWILLPFLFGCDGSPAAAPVDPVTDARASSLPVELVRTSLEDASARLAPSVEARGGDGELSAALDGLLAALEAGDARAFARARSRARARLHVLASPDLETAPEATAVLLALEMSEDVIPIFER